MVTVEIHASPEELAQAAAALFAERASAAVSARGRFSAALSGGRTPAAYYALLAKPPFASQIPWERVHLFWGDERCVPPDHGDSNYRLARERLIDHVPVPPANVHRIHGEMDPVEAAARYEGELREFFGQHGQPCPAFDAVFLGLGEDGHTASLFPGSPAIRESVRQVSAQYVDAQKGWRITLTPPAINAARLVVFIAAGKSKAAVLRDVLEGPFLPEVRPAQAVRPLRGELRWLLDRDAAQLLKPRGRNVS